MTTFADKLFAASADESLTPDELRHWMRRAALRLQYDQSRHSDREIVARFLCRHDGHSETSEMAGRPMWERYLDVAGDVLEDEDNEPAGSG